MVLLMDDCCIDSPQSSGRNPAESSFFHKLFNFIRRTLKDTKMQRNALMLKKKRMHYLMRNVISGLTKNQKIVFKNYYF